MPIIIPANSAVGGGFDVDNSLRFNRPSSDYLNRTQSGGSATTKITFSTWLKRTNLGIETWMFDAPNSSNQSDGFRHLTNDTLQFLLNDNYVLTTNRVFRDTSAWYHLVVVMDTTQGTDSNRVKIYVNGVQETSFSATSYPSQNATAQGLFVSGRPLYIGRQSGGNYLDGYLAETVFIDGQALAPTSFGEFDEDSGVWKPIDVSGLTFGTNGCYLDFEDSSALGNDAAGSNNFTVNNLTAIDQSTDTCTNNFATWNRLIAPTFSNHNLIDGNLTVEGETSSQNTAFTTFAVSQGKWFCEMKLTVEGNSSSTVPNFGIASTADFRHADSEAYSETSGTNIYAGAVNNSQINRNGSNSGTSLSTTPDVGDIMGLALDLDSGTKTLKFYLNGSLVGTVNINADEYCFITAVKEDNNKATVQGNFGGTNTYTVSSGNADGNGYGNFEYAVPSGYLSLNTKNLSEVLS